MFDHSLHLSAVISATKQAAPHACGPIGSRQPHEETAEIKINPYLYVPYSGGIIQWANHLAVSRT